MTHSTRAARSISDSSNDRTPTLSRRFRKPAYWSDAPPPAPAPAGDSEELGPTRYGDWVRKGIAVDF